MSALRRLPSLIARPAPALGPGVALAQRGPSVLAQPLARLCSSSAPSFYAGTSPAVLSKERITLSKEEADTFSRWSIMPRSFAVLIPSGAVYVWSMWQQPLTTSLGVLAPAAADWGVASVGTTFSCLAVGFAFAVGAASPWVARAGPRYASMLGAALFGGGYFMAAAGAKTQTLPLIWSGWGLCGGLGWGLSYIAAVSALMSWFPDKKGLASGLGIGAFAGGGLFAAPMIEQLCAAAPPPQPTPHRRYLGRACPPARGVRGWGAWGCMGGAGAEA